jgi:tetratricopeptide (TPR) repeat protein
MFACALLAVSAFASEDWRGNNRLQGTVVDKSTGKPVAGAKVKLRKGASGPDTTTDASGKWAVLGLAAGAWNIDIEAQGYETKQGSVGLGEGQRVPPMKIEIDPMAAPVAATPEAAPVEEGKIGGVAVTPEIAASVEAGNKLVSEQKYKEAVAEYEKAYPSLSSNIGLKLALARAYYGSGELKKAIVLMEEAYKADPQPQTGVLLANMYVEDGQADKAKEIVEKLPAGSITDPMIFVNMGIAAMNKKQPSIGVGYFGKAIELDPKRYEGYYYRGLAYLQMNKAKDAKPDLQKVLELAPADSQDLKDAKEYLKSIK